MNRLKQVLIIAMALVCFGFQRAAKQADDVDGGGNQEDRGGCGKSDN
jgi:hypothetical protein